MATTTQEIGRRIGQAIARDTIADDLPREWTGLEAQDGDQIPLWATTEADAMEEIEAAAKAAYLEAIEGK